MPELASAARTVARLSVGGIAVPGTVAHAGVLRHTATQTASGILRDPLSGKALYCRELLGQLAADQAFDLAAD